MLSVDWKWIRSSVDIESTAVDFKLGCCKNSSLTWVLNLENCLRNPLEGFPGGAVVESLPANAGDTGSSPGLGRSHMPQSN